MISAPVLVALAVKADGQKVVLDLELLQSESSECWGGFVEGLVDRGLRPQWSLENRPMVVMSKPANGLGPRLGLFYLFAS